MTVRSLSHDMRLTSVAEGTISINQGPIIDYGPLTTLLIKRVDELKLFKCEQPSMFLEEILKFYSKNEGEMKKDNLAMLRMKKLISIIPSCSQLKGYIKSDNINKHTIIMLKVIIDILIGYYSAAELPLFTYLRQEIIPLALSFYEFLSPDSLNKVKLKLYQYIINNSIIMINNRSECINTNTRRKE